MTKPSEWAIPTPPPAQPAISGLDYDLLQQCIHCGFCIQSCPTYRQTGLEVASPRGRISLMRAVAEGKLPVDAGFAEPINLCLGCRACETACPSGVQYGRLLEQARELVAPVSPAPWYVALGMKYLLPYPRRMRAVRGLVAFAQRAGLLRILPGAMRELAAALPKVRRPGSVRPSGVAPAAASPSQTARAATAAAAQPAGVAPVLFFHGCIQEALLHGQNEAALRVLAASGGAVAVPGRQTCCGALHAHYGRMDEARELARRNIAAFEQFDGPIVNHAGGCGAQLKEYGRLLADDPAWAGRAAAFAARVKDLSEWLTDHPIPADRLGPVAAMVTYQDSCHLAHGQKIRRQPRAVIREVPGVTYREMENADQCCGSAGIYNILQAEMAGKVLAEKMETAQATGATLLVTANPGCYMQLCQGVRRHGLAERVEVLSLAELLDRSLEGAAATPPRPTAPG